MCPEALLGRRGEDSKEENCTFPKDKAGKPGKEGSLRVGLLPTLCYLFAETAPILKKHLGARKSQST